MSRFNKADFLKKLHEIQKDKKFVPDSVWDEKFLKKTIATNSDQKHFYSIGEKATLCQKLDIYNPIFHTGFWINFQPTNGGMFVIESIVNRKARPTNKTEEEPVVAVKTNKKNLIRQQLFFF